MSGRSGSQVYQSLVVLTAAGEGVTYDCNGRDKISWQYSTTGSPSAVSVSFQGRVSSSAPWETLNTQTDTTSYLAVGTTPFPLYQARLVLDTLTGGTNPTVSGWILME